MKGGRDLQVGLQLEKTPPQDFFDVRRSIFSLSILVCVSVPLCNWDIMEVRPGQA